MYHPLHMQCTIVVAWTFNKRVCIDSVSLILSNVIGTEPNLHNIMSQSIINVQTPRYMWISVYWMDCIPGKLKRENWGLQMWQLNNQYSCLKYTAVLYLITLQDALPWCSIQLCPPLLTMQIRFKQTGFTKLPQNPTKMHLFPQYTSSDLIQVQ